MGKKFAELYDALSPESKQWVEEQVKVEEKKMALSDLRKARHITQTQLAQTLNIKQPSIADMEKRTDMYISTLRSLIEGMGGKLEITAIFPDTEVQIKNFSEI